MEAGIGWTRTSPRTIRLLGIPEVLGRSAWSSGLLDLVPVLVPVSAWPAAPMLGASSCTCAAASSAGRDPCARADRAVSWSFGPRVPCGASRAMVEEPRERERGPGSVRDEGRRDSRARLRRRRPRRPRRGRAGRGDPGRRGRRPGGRRRRDRPRRAAPARTERARLRRLRPGPRRGARPGQRLLRRRPDLRQGQLRRRGPADPAGLRRLPRPAGAAGRRLRQDVPRHRAGPARQVPALGVRLQRRRAEHPRLGPVRTPWNTAHSSGASRPARRRSSRPAPYPSPTRTTAAARSGSRPRSTGWSASSRPAAGWPRTR